MTELNNFRFSMTTPVIPRWLITLSLAIAVPSISCVGYYGLENLGPLSDLLRILTILAYPATLIGFSWFIINCFSGHRTGFHLWLSAVSFAIPATFLLIIHL